MPWCPCTEPGWGGTCAPCAWGEHTACADPPGAPSPELPAAYITRGPGGPPTHNVAVSHGLPIPPVVWETCWPHRRPPCSCTCHACLAPGSYRLPSGPPDPAGTPSLL